MEEGGRKKERQKRQKKGKKRYMLVKNIVLFNIMSFAWNSITDREFKYRFL